MPDYKKHIIVIGAGIGGLSTAIRLAAKGYRVRVFERQPQIGGKLNQLVRDGFSFDTGPSLITMPVVLRELFESVSRRLEDYLELVPLDITYRYFYHDGLVLNAWRDFERLVEEFARVNEHDGEALRCFMSYAERIYAKSGSFQTGEPPNPYDDAPPQRAATRAPTRDQLLRLIPMITSYPNGRRSHVSGRCWLL